MLWKINEKSLIEAEKNIAILQQTVKHYEEKFQDLSGQLLTYKSQNAVLEDSVLSLDTYIRRENLKFSGVVEDQRESNSTTANKIRNIFVNKMNIRDGNDIKFQRCHRLGKRTPDKGPHDIIVRFLWYEDREKIWQCKTKLKNSGIVVKEDFPMIIEQRRSKLYPVFRAAKEKNLKPLLIADKQYFQYSKAIHCGNSEIAGKITATINPVDQKRLGHKLKPSNEQWNDNLAEKIMETSIKAKFRQNLELRQKLLSTGNKDIVECNPYDKYWGNGLALNTKDAHLRSNWKGKNMMGELLCRVRSELK